MFHAKRDFVGYGNHPPHPHWPNGARIAINFVLNYEEGSEANVLEGDAAAETYLAEIAGMTAQPGQRNFFSESIFEYGSRAGVWRILNLFEKYHLPLTIFACGLALERNQELCQTLAKSDHEIVGHGYRWINYGNLTKEAEKEDIKRTIETIKKLTGKAPIGWYTGRHSPNTRSLVVEAGLTYDSDNYSDDLPFWQTVDNQSHLIIPYTFDNNDAKYSMAPGWMSGDDFYKYLCASFDTLYAEGESAPKMMTVALHGRFSGRPGRAEALKRFIEYVKAHDHVWICKRSEIATHWMENFPDITSENESQPALRLG